MSLVDQVGLDAYRRLLLRDRIVRDPSSSVAWMVGLDAAITSLVTGLVATQVAASTRASVAQVGAFSLAAADKGAIDDLAGTYSVTVPVAATLGDPWWYDGVVTSGTVTFAGGQSSTPVSASGAGTPVRMYVANGKVYLRSGSGATVTRVA